MNLRMFTAAVLLTSAASTGAVADGDLERGRLRAASCMGCHGAPGMRNAYPGYRVPKLGGQHTQYIVDALKAYKTGQRAHPTMRAQATTLTEQDMTDIATYFNAMADVKQPQ